MPRIEGLAGIRREIQIILIHELGRYESLLDFSFLCTFGVGVENGTKWKYIGCCLRLGSHKLGELILPTSRLDLDRVLDESVSHQLNKILN